MKADFCQLSLFLNKLKSESCSTNNIKSDAMSLWKMDNYMDKD